MGLLIDGRWSDQWYSTTESKGKFVRSVAQFRNWITETGERGPSGFGGFKAEAHRYHLYVSYACPWANRTLIVRALKGLEKMISISVVHPIMLENGWTFEQDDAGATGDQLLGNRYLHELYTQVDPKITTRVTVPVLWDKKTQTIVSNESSEIVRMFNHAFDQVTGSQLDLYPLPLRSEIDELNERIYHTVNNGVYLAGFATSQEAYTEAVSQLFETLDWLEHHLEGRRFLVGNSITESDIRLAVTLFRFDLVYVQHFKTDRNRLVDFPNLWRYARRIYQYESISETVNFKHIRDHYFLSHPTINPHGIIPIGPQLDWDSPVD